MWRNVQCNSTAEITTNSLHPPAPLPRNSGGYEQQAGHLAGFEQQKELTTAPRLVATHRCVTTNGNFG